MSLDLDAVRRNVDRIATTQEQITRSVDQITAGQERMTREITKLQYKNSEPPPRPTPAPARKSALRSSRASAVRIGVGRLDATEPLGLRGGTVDIRGGQRLCRERVALPCRPISVGRS
jgi:hypothetical protein